MVSSLKSEKTSSSKSVVKSIKNVFSSKASKNKDKATEVKAEEPVEVSTAVESIDATRDMPAITDESENTLDASEVMELKDTVAAAETPSKLMVAEEDAVSAKSSKSNKSLLSRLSKLSAGKSETPATIVEEKLVDEAILESTGKVSVEEEDTVSVKSSKSNKSTLSRLSGIGRKSKGKSEIPATIVEEEAVVGLIVEKSTTATPVEGEKLVEETSADEEQAHTEPAEAEVDALPSSPVALPSPDAARSVLVEENQIKTGFFCFAC
jgi:hypothetical protein